MKSKRFKDTIIEDYAIISNTKNYCEFCLCQLNLTENETKEIKSLYNFALELNKTYKKIMFRLGLIDLSLAILDRDFLLDFCDKKETYLWNKSNFLLIFKKYEMRLKMIGNDLSLKLKKMELNNFECNYLNLDKLSKPEKSFRS
ncbi:MAG: hypothetical protein HFI85_02475 [Clostridia bacterium]|jgi:hypothetical protein|nr:hypothetical protein [Clostridia bacterium]